MFIVQAPVLTAVGETNQSNFRIYPTNIGGNELVLPERVVAEEENENLFFESDIFVHLTIGSNCDPLLLNLRLDTNNDLKAEKTHSKSI